MGVRTADVVIHSDGLRRSIPLTTVDSVQEFIAPRAPGKTGAIVGALVLGGGLGWMYNGLCDYNCAKGTAVWVGIGALVGGALGRAIGGGVSAAQGAWVTRYRRPD